MKKKLPVTKTNGTKVRIGICKCGHTGGVSHSEHYDNLEYGHGDCKKCPCPQFTWKGWKA